LKEFRRIVAEIRERFRDRELWELWLLALLLIGLIGILSRPFSPPRASLADFGPGEDPYDTRPARSEREANGHKERGF
jgi:hypothetical protein